MLELISKGLWSTIQQTATGAKRRRAAVAYVTDSELLPLGQDDVLIVDASDASIAAGRTDAVTLEGYLGAGVRMVSIANLHAKVFVLDGIAIIGSANASRRSANHYVEAAVMSDRHELVAQTELLINTLMESEAGESIDHGFIDRIKKIEVVKSENPRPDGQPAASGVVIKPSKCWLVNTWENQEYPGDDEAVQAETQRIQESIGEDAGLVYWFWMPSSGAFASVAKPGDVVIEASRAQQKASPTNKTMVFEHARIKEVIQEHGQKVKTFHCVFPIDWDKTKVTWAAFEQLAKRAGINRKLPVNGQLLLTESQSGALSEIWPRKRRRASSSRSVAG
ncbi:hypothetical protein SAMN05414139_01479 [Burkholderia sp. D7]|nr:hypothetical protein SAMN05414139_01479 [Burkholderia sp. D7]